MLHQGGRALEPPGPELGNPMRCEAVGEGPEAEEQTRIRILSSDGRYPIRLRWRVRRARLR